MSGDFLTQRLHRWGWLAWLVVIVCVGWGVVSDWEIDRGRPPAYAWLDAIVTALCVLAVASLVVTQAAFDVGAPIGRVGRWLALTGCTVIAARFLYSEAVLGEVPVHPASVAAIGAIALSVLFRQVEIWATAYFDAKGGKR